MLNQKIADLHSVTQQIFRIILSCNHSGHRNCKALHDRKPEQKILHLRLPLFIDMQLQIIPKLLLHHLQKRRLIFLSL